MKKVNSNEEEIKRLNKEVKKLRKELKCAEVCLMCLEDSYRRESPCKLLKELQKEGY